MVVQNLKADKQSPKVDAKREKCQERKTFIP